MIHIACNIDDNYIMQCCTTLVSVMYNNRNEQITFHIIAEKLSNEAKSMLTEEVEKYDQQIHFYAYNLNMNLSSFKSAHISLAAYLRLFVADILPAEIHKILYLDCVERKSKQLHPPRIPSGRYLFQLGSTHHQFGLLEKCPSE